MFVFDSAEGITMTECAKIIEMIGNSDKSWEHAAQVAVARACKTIRNVRGIDVTNQTAEVENGKIKNYRVTLKLAFGIEE